MDAEHEYAKVFQEAGPGIWRALYAYCGGRREIAQEAMGEAFARAMEHRGIRDPAAWITRVALRVAAEELKRERHIAPAEDAGRADQPTGLEGLLWALERLSPNQRVAIVLRYEVGLPVDEVARMMGVTQATVRVHLHRGRKQMRRLLLEGEAEHV